MQQLLSSQQKKYSQGMHWLPLMLLMVNLLSLLSLPLLAQDQAKVDSLTKTLETDMTDKEKVDTYNAIAYEYRNQDSVKTTEYASKAIALSEKINYPEGISDAYYRIGAATIAKGNYAKATELFGQALTTAQKASYPKEEANAYNGLGVIHYNQGDYPQALEYYLKSLKIREEIGDKNGMAASYNNIGNIHKSQGDYPQALEYYLKSLKIREERGDKNGMASSYNNIGIIHQSQGDYPQALEYYLKSLKIQEEIGDKSGMSNSYESIGIIHQSQGDYPQALEYTFKSLKIREERGDKNGMASSYNNIGYFLYLQKQYDSAYVYYRKSAKINTAMNDKALLSLNYNNMADALTQMGKLDSVLHYAEKSLSLATEIANKRVIARVNIIIGKYYQKQAGHREAVGYLEKGIALAQEAGLIEEPQIGFENLYLAYKALGQYDKSLKAHEGYMLLKDSVINKENAEKITRQSMQFAFDKKEALAQAEQEKEALLHAEELERRNYIIYGVIVGLLGIVAFAVQSVRSNRQKQRANQQLSAQNEEIKQQKEEIQQQTEEIAAQRDNIIHKHQEMEAAYENIKMLSEIGQQVNASLSIETIVATVYQNVNRLMDATVFALGVYNKNTQAMEFTGAMEHGQQLPYFTDVTTDNNSLSDYCFNKQTEIFIEDMEQEYRNYLPERKLQAGEQMRSIIYIPLTVKGKQKGLITVQSPKVGQYTENHRNLLRNLAVYVSTAIENADEHEKSEKLLLNILPQETAQELKETGVATTKAYEQVSVLFTDFKGFTLIAAQMGAEEVVENLDYCFQAFDDIVKKHGLEKIKTIGDAYMCAGGIPQANTDNAQRCVAAALEMKQFMANWKAEKEAQGKQAWEVRIGIHTGPVVAGVVGKDKFAYDIWGDTVNLASRMESSGEVGKVNISGDTHRILTEMVALTPQWKFEYRGKVQAKNKGEVDMYFVEG